jgi:hypothetical protein
MTTQESSLNFILYPLLGYTGQIIEIINLSCKNEAWIALGSTLIWLEKIAHDLEWCFLSLTETIN